MIENLSTSQFLTLLEKVFAPSASDRVFRILVDLPSGSVPDTAAWRDRRQIAGEWLKLVQEGLDKLPFSQAQMLYMENSGSNNAQFRTDGYFWEGDAEDASFDRLKTDGRKVDLAATLSATNIILAPTQFSPTAPLKLLARVAGFRAASMPGFSRDMIPALGLDYEVVHQRVMAVKTRLDEAQACHILFDADGSRFELFADLRHRQGHASSGLLRDAATATNLPSGESYIVPYEGELRDASLTKGMLPVQFGDEIVIYRVEANRAVDVTSSGEASVRERSRLKEEPAYGNIAELGFGVLRPFGIKPVGVVLLDEKLGLHIAFGRSDHFGGATSPESFKDAKNVVHIDRIYIPDMQDKVVAREVRFAYPDGREEVVIRDGELLQFE